MSSTVYAAIGDIHGRLDLLEPLYGRLKAILETDYPANAKKRIVFLGDYVDRGPYSKEVVDFLLQIAPDPRHVILPGNHEQLMHEFITADDEDDLIDASKIWFRNGGLETLQSYLPDHHPVFEYAHQENEFVLEEVRDAIPKSHKSFLNSVLNGRKPYHLDRDAGLFFVHAGVDPSKRLQDHGYNEFLWTPNKSFLEGKAWVEGLKIIHANTITENPVNKDHRIGIDTGAFMSRIVTAVIIDNDGQIKFVQETL